jgi:putative addiction module component (TIGR02574 family)
VSPKPPRNNEVDMADTHPMKVDAGRGTLELMQRAEILKAALQLPEDEREKLVDELTASLRAAGALSPAWEAEIARRLSELEAGETTSDSAEEVLEGVEAIIRAGRDTR